MKEIKLADAYWKIEGQVHVYACFQGGFKNSDNTAYAN